MFFSPMFYAHFHPGDPLSLPSSPDDPHEICFPNVPPPPDKFFFYKSGIPANAQLSNLSLAANDKSTPFFPPTPVSRFRFSLLYSFIAAPIHHLLIRIFALHTPLFGVLNNAHDARLHQILVSRILPLASLPESQRSKTHAALTPGTPYFFFYTLPNVLS